ncbi:hypothetical protein [Enterococcus nangangensis]|uniref:hypothetical protein n=1 Tax=Enterococcus nangangensis TaxID=2559926 RepID=UPI0010F63DA9|nr:hypothetical protein [Enterococcus nangangensis]
MKHYLIKYGRYYLLSVDRKTDKHPSKLTLVEFKSGATWYQKEKTAVRRKSREEWDGEQKVKRKKPSLTE